VKRNLITVIGAIAIIGGVVVFNSKFNKSMDPNQADAAETKTETTGKETAPYQVKFETSKGDFIVEVTPELSPLGAEQFKEAVTAGVYDNAKFFRVLPDFVVQWGIPADPKLAAVWDKKTIQDEPVKASNVAGTITFAKSSMPNSRTSQVFINLANNEKLDGMGFSPFGKVVEGMDVVKQFYAEYGSDPSDAQQQIQAQGNAFLDRQYPKLDFIKKATIVGADGGHGHEHEAETPSAG
jgi:cyclophilin family peptidyl-prolyl cis-trans isomerase